MILYIKPKTTSNVASGSTKSNKAQPRKRRFSTFKRHPTSQSTRNPMENHLPAPPIWIVPEAGKVLMIGKIFGTFLGNKRDNGENKTRKAQGMSDNYDYSRQLFSTLKSMETASRTRNALGERMFETTWTTRDNFSKVRRPTGRREGRGWESGWGADGTAIPQ